MKFRGLFFLIIAGAISLSSCASLSKSQMNTIQSFSNSCENYSKYPGVLFTEMAKIRADRGCFFSASLSNPDLRIKELNAINKALVSDLELGKKADVSLEILKTYQRALKSLSHADRYNNTGREFRSLGRNLDSLVKKYNQLDISDPLPLGVGKAVGKIVGYGAELYVRNVQTRAVRSFVVEGDTLVSAVCNNIVKIMSGSAVVDLIENEVKGLDANFLSYIKSSNGSFSDDKEYLLLLSRVNNLKKLRSGTVTAAKAISKAHNKIAKEVVKRKKVKQIYIELQELDDEISALRKSIETLNL